MSLGWMGPSDGSDLAIECLVGDGADKERSIMNGDPSGVDMQISGIEIF